MSGSRSSQSTAACARRAAPHTRRASRAPQNRPRSGGPPCAAASSRCLASTADRRLPSTPCFPVTLLPPPSILLVLPPPSGRKQVCTLHEKRNERWVDQRHGEAYRGKARVVSERGRLSAEALRRAVGRAHSLLSAFDLAGHRPHHPGALPPSRLCATICPPLPRMLPLDMLASHSCSPTSL